MPAANIDLQEVISTLLPSAANVVAVCGVASKAIQSQYYVFDPDASAASIRSALGDGEGVEGLVTELRYGKRRAVFFPVTPTVAGSISSVTETRPGSVGAILTDITPSAISASGDVLVTGPWHSLDVCILISETGIGGVGKFRYSLDHQIKDGRLVGTFSGDIIIPVAKPAQIVGTVDLSTLTLADLNTLTAIVTSDSGGPSTCTFTTPTNVADLISQLNTAWSGEAVASLVGANRLLISSVTAGSSGTLSLGNGTANTLLGITNGTTATGTAATFDIPNTGIRLTAASGSFTAGDYYTFSTKAPKIASGALAALFTRIKAAINAGQAIGAVWPTQEDADPIDARTMLDALSTQLTTARNEKYYLWALYQLPRTAVDSEIVTYVGTFTDPYVAVSAGGFRSAGGLLTGSRFHRPASWVAARKVARDRFSSDLGNHADGVLTSVDFGLTEIGRDERVETVKLATYRTPQTGDGGGFLVLETMPNGGEVYFYQGRTMAQDGSVLGNIANMRLLLAMARQAQRDLDRFVNSDPPLRSDGSLVNEDTIKRAVEGPLEDLLFADPLAADTPHASQLGVGLPVYTSATKTLSIAIQAKRNALAKDVRAILGVGDVISVQEVV